MSKVCPERALRPLLDWVLSPNPAKDKLYFTNVDSPEQVELRAFNIFGELIWQAKHNTTDAIEVSNWTSGLYFIEINTTEGQQIEKVMIN